jgi:hypothetical protein
MRTAKAVIALSLILAWNCAASAQTQPAPNNATATERPAADSKPAAEADSNVTAMEDPQVGDHWTYSMHDRISGAEEFVATITVADVSAHDITTRYERIGAKPGSGYTVSDRSWNIKDNGVWKYSPSDGMGIRSPLKPGMTWRVRGTAMAHGNSNTRSGTSKVAGEENVTTSAGTFDTFKIETNLDIHLPRDPARKVKLVRTAWYAPSIDHWVKIESKTTVNDHVTASTSLTLVDYGRR